jgi:hypothetical protein
MALRYRYHLDAVQHPVIPLGGRWVRPRPLISVTLIGPTDSRLRLGLLDTGADDTLFPDSLAAVLGVDLSNAPAGTGRGVGLGAVPVRYAQVGLRITDGRERREWTGWVGFTPAPLVYPTLGFAGFLQFFTATFRGDREEVELTVNNFYRGT